MVNPGEMHDGIPVRGNARAWRILYLDPALVAREIANEPAGDALIVRPVARDPQLAKDVLQLFAAAENHTPAGLATEESLVRCLMRVLHRHGVHGPRTVPTSPSVMKAVRRLDAAPEIPTSLAELAALSGVSRFQLLRGFAREIGTTPHAYLVQRRVRLVRQMLANGRSPADAALLAGFASKPHDARLCTTVRRYAGAVQGCDRLSRPAIRFKTEQLLAAIVRRNGSFTDVQRFHDEHPPLPR
jgi:AraC-like DNA-binding protein